MGKATSLLMTAKMMMPPASFVGTHTRAFHLDFGARTAGPADPVSFNIWVTKNCLLAAIGTIVQGHWPLALDGAQVVVQVPAGAVWSFKRVGGAADCSMETVLAEPVTIIATRNDARLNTACDCPWDYIDADSDLIADECE